MCGVKYVGVWGVRVYVCRGTYGGVCMGAVRYACVGMWGGVRYACVGVGCVCVRVWDMWGGVKYICRCGGVRLCVGVWGCMWGEVCGGVCGMCG